jgi:formamidopyrimidine-DNA glycosylase
MPELPEVETIKNDVLPFVKNKIISNVVVRNAKLRWPVTRGLSKILVSQKIKDVMRRGKYLIFYCDKGSLLIHLGMSGTLTIVEKNTPAKKHDHVDICFANGFCLRFSDPRKFGCVLWVKGDPLKYKLLRNLGVEPLSCEFNSNYLFSKTCKSNRAIKLLLMDSKVVVGVGNIYANEALFRAGVHPETLVKNLSKRQCSIIVRAVKKVLADAIKAGGTSFKDYRKADGTPGYFQQKLLVYGRQGQPCKKCKTILQSMRLGQRMTVFCPVCQKTFGKKLS